MATSVASMPGSGAETRPEGGVAPAPLGPAPIEQAQPIGQRAYAGAAAAPVLLTNPDDDLYPIVVNKPF